MKYEKHKNTSPRYRPLLSLPQQKPLSHTAGFALCLSLSLFTRLFCYANQQSRHRKWKIKSARRRLHTHTLAWLGPILRLNFHAKSLFSLSLTHSAPPRGCISTRCRWCRFPLHVLGWLKGCSARHLNGLVIEPPTAEIRRTPNRPKESSRSTQIDIPLRRHEFCISIGRSPQPIFGVDELGHASCG